MAVVQRATVKPVGSVFIFNYRSGKTHHRKRVGAHGIPHHLRYGGDVGFLEGIQKIDGGC